MEVSFSSENFQWYLNNISKIHTHFLVKKSIFKAKAYKRDDLVLRYKESAESEDYMLTLIDTHTNEKYLDELYIKENSLRKFINSNMKFEKTFSLYIEEDKNIMVISFLPIRNIEDKLVAWIVSYEDSPIIKSALFNTLVIRLVSLFISLLIIYFFIKLIQAKQKLKEKNTNIEKQHKQFNERTNHDLTKLFIENKGSLHRGLLNDGKSTFELIIKTPEEKRIVTVLDKDFNDNYGHLIGDEVLISMSNIVSKNIRETDTFARWGGEEFVILYKNTNIENAKEISLKLKNLIAQFKHDIAGNMTVSFGLTQFVKGDTVESIFKRCDDALYLAKQNGRDRIEIL